MNEFAPGIDDLDELVALMTSADLPVPADIASWFRWHNGLTRELFSGPSVGSQLVLKWMPLSIEQALAQRAKFLNTLTPQEWPPEWLPIAIYSGGETLAAKCERAENVPTPLRAAWPVGGYLLEQEASYSISETVHWWLDALNAGHYVVEHQRGDWIIPDETKIPLEQRTSFLL